MVKWRFYISHGFVVNREVFPVNFNECSFVDQREQDQIFFRRKLDGKIKFINNQNTGVADFDYLYALFNSDYCEQITILIRRVDGSINDWTGFFRLRNGRWDIDRCTYETEVEPVDDYSCILEKWETKYNVLVQEASTFPLYDDRFYEYDYVTMYSEKYHIDEIREVGLVVKVRSTLTDVGTFGCVPSSPPYDYNLGHPCEGILRPSLAHVYSYPDAWSSVGWQLYYAKFDYVNVFFPDPNYVLIDVNITYIRESIITFDVGGVPQPPAGANWINIGPTTLMGQPATKYSRPVFTTGSMLSYGDWTWTESQLVSEIQHVAIGQYTQYQGARFVKEVLEGALTNICNAPVISDFFQWNPENVSTTNYVTQATTEVNRLYMYCMSDWISPGASNPATLAETTLKQLLDFLRIAFNVYWYIDANGNMRLEHISYFAKTVVLDLTALQYARFVNAKNKFSYIDSPKNERWEFAEQYQPDFVGMQLIYTCYQKPEEMIYGDSNFRTDPFASNNNGFIMVAVDGSGAIMQTVGAITGSTRNNAALSIANLMANYHTYNRYMAEGTLNGTLTTFDTVRKLRQQDELTVPYCGEIDPKELVRTGLGDGEVQSMRYLPKNEEIKITVLHD